MDKALGDSTSASCQYPAFSWQRTVLRDCAGLDVVALPHPQHQTRLAVHHTIAKPAEPCRYHAMLRLHPGQ